MDILSGFFIGAGLKELRGGSPGRNIYSRDLRDDFVGLYRRWVTSEASLNPVNVGRFDIHTI